MKIGILTFHCAYNYGAVLQTYALQEYLRQAGHEVSIINYRPNYLASLKPQITLKQLITRHPLKLWWNLKTFPKKRKFFKTFSEFETHYINIQSISTENQYDYIIIGSDQVWNKLYNGNDMIWYGNINKYYPKSKIITYAASAGNATDNNIQPKTIYPYISKLSAISVREECLQQKLLNEANIHSEVVLDPTLLISPSIWERWKGPVIKGDYILVYQAREDINVIRIAKNLAYTNKCQVITIDFYPSSQSKGCKHYIASPIEFVRLIKYAKCVVTTSFHGTAFSIICQTPFYTIRLNDGADDRSYKLLSSLNLKDRMIDKESNNIELKNIDFSKVKDLWIKLQKKSQQYLTNSLKI